MTETPTTLSRVIAPCPDNYTVITHATDWDASLKRHVPSLKVWDLETGTWSKRLSWHRSHVTSIASTPDGARALIASRDFDTGAQNLDLWDVDGDRCLWTTDAAAKKVLISSDGRRGISLTNETGPLSLSIWDLDSGACIRVVEGDVSIGDPVIITPDNRRVIYCLLHYHGLKVLDLNTGEDLHLLAGPGNILRYAIMPDGNQILTETNVIRNGRGLDLVQIWDLATGECIRVLEGLTRILAFFPAGEQALDSRLRIWDLSSGECLRTVSPEYYEAGLISVTPDGRRAVTFSEKDDAIRLWDLQQLSTPDTIEGHAGEVCAVVPVPGTCQVASSSLDGTTKLWNLRTGGCLSTVSGHTARNGCATPDGRYLISGWYNRIRVWDLQRGQHMEKRLSTDSEIRALCLSLTGERILAGTNVGTAFGTGVARLEVWDIDNEKPLHVFELPPQRIDAVAMTPNSCTGITASPYYVTIWDLVNLRSLHTLAFHDAGGEVSQFATLPDGTRFITVNDRRKLNLWDIQSGLCLRTIDVTTGVRVAGKATLMPDGRGVVVDSFDMLKVFDLETGNCVIKLEKEKPAEAYVATISDDGRHFVAGSYSGHFEIWDLATAKKLTEFIGEGALPGTAYHPNVVISDNTIMYGDQTGRVYFLSLENVTLSAPVITTWRNVPNGLRVAFGCPHCRTWSEVPASALGTELSCPECNKPVKLNPFVIEADWRPVVAAWRGDKLPTATTPPDAVAQPNVKPIDRVDAESATPPAQKPKPEAPLDSLPASTRASAVPPPARRSTFAAFAQKIKTALGKEPPRE